VSQNQLKNVLFPLADLDKKEVRKIAEENGLVTAEKKDSTGICFIGERNFRKFLKDFIPMQEGDICDMQGNVIGRHDGVMYYTLGQRRGLNLGGKEGYENDRWFVVKKDVKKNILYVNCGECDEMFSTELEATGFNWITEKHTEPFECFVKCRYRQPDQKARCEILENGNIRLIFEEKQRAVTPGQYAVLYAEDGMCYGGGEIISCK